MPLLHDIQKSVVKEGPDLGSVLLKLRYLASRLGSDYLEDWVKHESEGYPPDSEVPEYRKVPITYRATFSGPFGSAIQNAQVPLYLIDKHAGRRWLFQEVRESIAAVEDMVQTTGGSEANLCIDASNLILLLQGKMYPGYSCVDIDGRVSEIAVSEIVQAVRSRILELTIELEKTVPIAADINLGGGHAEAGDRETVRQITQQVVYGNQTTVFSGPSSKLTLTIGNRNDGDFVREVSARGVPIEDAQELVSIMASEEPGNAEEPFGVKARKWLAGNLKKATEGTWKIGVTAATKLLSEAALKYYGLK